MAVTVSRPTRTDEERARRFAEIDRAAARVARRILAAEQERNAERKEAGKEGAS
jgi:hypothetical protein